MNKVTNDTFSNVLNDHLNNNKIVAAISGRLHCENCHITKINILNYLEKNPDTNIDFLYLDGSIDDILESSYYQMEELNEYPKTAIFISSKNLIFKEGILTEEDLYKIEKLKKNKL